MDRADSSSWLQEYRQSLEGMSGYDVVEQAALNTADIGAAEARRLLDIAHLNSMPCMVPSPPRQRSGSGARRARRSPCPLTSTDLTEAEIAARLNLSESRAGQLVATSVTVTSRLPQTLITLAEGRLDMPRVEIIAKHAGALADEHYQSARRAGLSPAVAEAAAREIAERLEEQILKRAVRQTTAGLGNSL